MSVIMMLEGTGDPKRLEQFAAENKDKMQAVLEAAKRHGLIAHRFYGSDDGGRLMVLDEWPDRQSFESFFREAGVPDSVDDAGGWCDFRAAAEFLAPARLA